LLATLVQQVAALGRQNEQMLAEVRELRQENADLRRQLAEARGVGIHMPYAVSSSWAPPPAPTRVQSLPQPMPVEDDVTMQPANPDPRQEHPAAAPGDDVL
jgi:hypothetical protein